MSGVVHPSSWPPDELADARTDWPRDRPDKAELDTLARELARPCPHPSDGKCERCDVDMARAAGRRFRDELRAKGWPV